MYRKLPWLVLAVLTVAVVARAADIDAQTQELDWWEWMVRFFIYLSGGHVDW